MRQGVLELLLNGTLERPGAVHRVEPGLAEQVERGVRDDQAQAVAFETLAQAVELDAGDLPDLLARLAARPVRAAE